MATIDTLLTAAEYVRLPDSGQPSELVRGRVVMMNVPTPRHGQVCGNVYFLVRQYVDLHALGHVVTNDSGVRTERDPDTMRGADVSYYSFEAYPPGRLPDGYLDLPPAIVFEVLSASDCWPNLLEKVGEYLSAGVRVVCALDPDESELHIYRADRPPQKLTEDDDLRLPELHPDFSVPVAKLFE